MANEGRQEAIESLALEARDNGSAFWMLDHGFLSFAPSPTLARPLVDLVRGVAAVAGAAAGVIRPEPLPEQASVAAGILTAIDQAGRDWDDLRPSDFQRATSIAFACAAVNRTFLRAYVRTLVDATGWNTFGDTGARIICDEIRRFAWRQDRPRRVLRGQTIRKRIGGPGG